MKHPFYTCKDFPKFHILEENYLTTLSELPMFCLSNDKQDRTAWNNPKGSHAWKNPEMMKLYKDLSTNDKWVPSWSPGWYNFPLIYDSKPVGLAREKCPKTVEMLESLDCNLAGFSCLLPQYSLPIHTDHVGPTFSSMALNQHIIGEDSNLYVEENGKFYQYIHNLSKVVIFDSEKRHFADNQSKTKSRVLLYIDFNIN